MASVAFVRGDAPVDALAGASVLMALAEPDLAKVQQIWLTVDGNSGLQQFTGGPLSPPFYEIRSDNLLAYVFIGTETYGQMVANVLGSIQSTLPGVPGRVHSFFGQMAENALAGILPRFPGQRGSRHIVLIGHSLGAAIAQLVAAMLAARHGITSRVWCYGSPKVGDFTFANSIPSTWIKRYENVGDPVPSLPPPAGAPVLSGAGQAYWHAGEARVLFRDQSRRTGNAEKDWPEAVADFLHSALLNDHYIQEYVIRLTREVDQSFFAKGGFGYGAVKGMGDAISILLAEDFGGDSAGLTITPIGGGMSVIRHILHFDNLAGRINGWSEVYFTAHNNVDAAKPVAIALALARRAILSTGCALAKLRLSQEGLPPFRDSLPIILPAADSVGMFGNIKAPEKTAPSFDAINYAMYSTSLYRGRVFVRGLPIGEVQNQSTSPIIFSTAFQNALDAFRDFLIVNNYQLYVQNKELPLPQGKIGAVSSDIAGNVTITTVGAHGLVDGDIVNIVGTTIRRVNGLAKVTVAGLGANAFRLSTKTVVVAVPGPIGKGYFWKYEKVLRPITGCEAVDITSRKVGRPFYQRRGRQSKRPVLA